MPTELHGDLWGRSSVTVSRVDTPGELREVMRIPDGKASLMYRALCSGPAELYFLGPLRRARRKWVRGVQLGVRVELPVGVARAVAGVPLVGLADRVVALEALWGGPGRALVGELAGLEADEIAARLRTAASACWARHPAPETVGIVTRAQALLAGVERESTTRVHDVAARVGVGERLLRRLFREELGLSPKRYARIVRLQRVLAAMPAQDPVPWSRLASEHGYFDQAHLVAEHRALIGTSPQRFRTGVRPELSRHCGS